MMTLRRQPSAARRSGARPIFGRRVPVLFVAAALIAGPTLLTGVDDASAQTTYSSWQPPAADDELSDFIGDLKGLVDKATDAKAADPQFLKDLNDLIASYENPWSTRLLFDDFSDGNYNANPTWTVSAGKYEIDPKGTFRGLRSHIVPEGVQTGQNIKIGNIVLGTIATGETGAGGHASIYTPLKISNAFRLEMAITSKYGYGRWDFGPYQGTSGNVAYRLTYFPAATPSLQLQRVTSQGTVAIASYDKPLRLETDSDHALVWTRDRSGMMHVAIDGQQLMAVQDTAIRDPFDGFLIINSGGQYSIRHIEILGRPVSN
jgi:hypothetical protein